MNIAIDITPLHTGHRNRGVGMYTKLLIEALQEHENNHLYYFFTRGQKIPNDVELIHYPYFDPFFITLPLFYDKPTVVTVHDLIPLVFPKHFPAGIRGSVKWIIQRWSLSRLNRLIVDSKASRQDIERIAGIQAMKIDVIYLAPSPSFHPIHNASLLHNIKAKYHLPERFILYVGDVNWNKNVEGLIRAFAILRRNKNEKTLLVLAGEAFQKRAISEVSRINELIASMNMGEAVIHPGYIKPEDLPAVYSLATVYVQPSFYEGFGLPVLEALACGTPVVCSREASLAEIAGPSFVIDPRDIEDIATKIRAVIDMRGSDRSEAARKGMEWVKQFSWRRVASETVKSYETTIS